MNIAAELAAQATRTTPPTCLPPWPRRRCAPASCAPSPAALLTPPRVRPSAPTVGARPWPRPRPPCPASTLTVQLPSTPPRADNGDQAGAAAHPASAPGPGQAPPPRRARAPPRAPRPVTAAPAPTHLQLQQPGPAGQAAGGPATAHPGSRQCRPSPPQWPRSRDRGGTSPSRTKCWRPRRCSGRPTRSPGRRRHSSSVSWPAPGTTPCPLGQHRHQAEQEPRKRASDGQHLPSP